MSYIFQSEYQKKEPLRQSFFALAKEIFGLNFQGWYEAGGWTKDYMSYSYALEEEIVANASGNRMSLIVHGQDIKALQIGTVMTKEAHRGQGLSEDLLRRLVKEEEKHYNLMFLLADEKAVPLYKRLGFEERKTYAYFVDPKDYIRVKESPPPMPLKVENFVTLMREGQVFGRDFHVKDAPHLYAFYFVHGFDAMVSSPITGVTVISEVEGDVLHLYEVCATKEVPLEKVLNSLLTESIQKVQLHFTPQKNVKGLYWEADKEAGFMVRGSAKDLLPKEFSYPMLYRA